MERFVLNGTYLFLLKKRIPYKKGIHDLERNLSLLGDTNRKDWNNFVPLTREAEKFAENVFIRHRINKEDSIIAISPGSAWPTKRWPVESFSKLAGQLIHDGFKVIILGSVNDLGVSHDLIQGIPYDIRKEAVNLTGQTGLKALAAVIKGSSLLVSNDSANIHIAAALGIPVVAIFGPTTTELGFYPYGKKHVVIEKKLACRPCGRHGGFRCRLRTHQCMVDIKVEEVLKEVSKKLRPHTN